MALRKSGNAPVTRASERRAARAGVLTQYTDGLGETRHPSNAAIAAICDCLEASESRSLSPMSIAIRGRRSFSIEGCGTVPRKAAATLLLEDGGELPLRLTRGKAPGACTAQAQSPLPLGVHEVIMSGSAAFRRFVAVRPQTLTDIVARQAPALAVFLPLYAIKPGGSNGIATYTDLHQLRKWADRVAGARVGTLPLFSAFLDRPFDPSPYAPVSRLMWNELYIDPTNTPEWQAPSVRHAANQPGRMRDVRRAAEAPLVDYRRSWAAARKVLIAMSAAARSSPARWSGVVTAASGEVMRYAQFRAAVDATGAAWPQWPASSRSRRIDTSHVKPDDVDMYIYAQVLARQQVASLRRAGQTSSPLYLDLPVGVHAGGFDTYTRPDLFLHALSAGAPPDALNMQGQTWGFPPMHPTAGRADGYAYLRAVLRQMCSVAGVLRVDHIMGLYRMYCVPNGQAGDAGAYLRYPQDELFAILTIEAARAGAMVVGEDLGTVPPVVRTLMKRSGIIGMHVQQFSIDKDVPAAANHVQASLNTHDTPTFAGFWHGDDIAVRRRLGHTGAEDSDRERRSRATAMRSLRMRLKKRRLPAANAHQAGMSLMRLQARSSAPLTLVNLEDLWGERQPQNVPGTTDEHPNWRRCAALPLPAILKNAAISRSLKSLRADRRRSEHGGKR